MMIIQLGLVTQILVNCSNDGYRDGQNNPFDQERNEECEELNEAKKVHTI